MINLALLIPPIWRLQNMHVSPFMSPKNLVATSGGYLPMVLPLLLWLWYHSGNQGCCWTDPMSLHWSRELLLLLYFWRWLFTSCMLLYKISIAGDDWRGSCLVAISSGEKYSAGVNYSTNLSIRHKGKGPKKPEAWIKAWKEKFKTNWLMW